MADVVVQMVQWLLIALSVGVGVVQMSIVENTDTPTSPVVDAAATPPFVCQARVPGGVCGATTRHPANPKNQCVKGHFIVGSQQRWVDGTRAFERHGDVVLPPHLRMSADDMLAGIIADKGGRENLTTFKREYVQQARNFRVMLDMILQELVRNGVTTKGGRVRSAVSKYLEIFDRFDKVAQRLGLEREAREAMSLTQRLAAAPLTRAEDHDAEASDELLHALWAAVEHASAVERELRAQAEALAGWREVAQAAITALDREIARTSDKDASRTVA